MNWIQGCYKGVSLPLLCNCEQIILRYLQSCGCGKLQYGAAIYPITVHYGGTVNIEIFGVDLISVISVVGLNHLN